MTTRSVLRRADGPVTRRAAQNQPGADTPRRDDGTRLFGRMKRALRKAERRAGDGAEIGGTGATILKFLPAPLVRLLEKKRIGAEEVRAADDIAVAFHAQAGALMIKESGVSEVLATADAGSDVAVRWLNRLGFKPADQQAIAGKLLFVWRRDDDYEAALPPR